MLESHFLNTEKDRNKTVPKDQKGNTFAGDKTHSPEARMGFDCIKYIDSIGLGFPTNAGEICCSHMEG